MKARLIVFLALLILAFSWASAQAGLIYCYNGELLGKDGICRSVQTLYLPLLQR